MSLKYFPSFDGLRAYSLILVMLAHWPYPVLSFPCGWIGLNMFFVLSGYLITRILLVAKERPLKTYLKRFYWNRIMRVLPLYYGYIFAVSSILLLVYFVFSANLPIILLQGVEAVKNDFIYLITFTYNFQDIWHLFDGNEDSNHVRFFSHFWSIALEEQYYLIFPVLVYFISTKNLKLILLLVVLLTPPLRLVVGEMLRGKENDYFISMILSKLTFFQMDGFALGGLVAISGWQKIKKPEYWLLGILFFGILVGLPSVYYLRQNGIEISWKTLGLNHPLYQYSQQTDNIFLNIRYAFTFTIGNIVGALFILMLIRRHAYTRFLENPRAVALGKISYGMYVFHFPLLALLIMALQHFKAEGLIKQNFLLEILLFIAYFTVVFSIARISFRFYESQFLRHKVKEY